MAMLGGECSPCCEGGGSCYARAIRCLSVKSLSGGITVSFDSNLPSVCDGPHDSISFQASDFDLLELSSGGGWLAAGEIVGFPDCNFDEGYRCGLRLVQTGPSGSRGDLVVVISQIVDSESFFRTWTRFEPIFQEEITLRSIEHRISGLVTIENYCKKTAPTQLTIPLSNPSPDDPAQYSGTATLTVPPPVEDNPCTVCNRGQFGDLVRVPRYHPIGDCDSDCPDTSGACCETDGTCSIKPQCECDTDNGAVFAGVGEGCEACAPCGCEGLEGWPPEITLSFDGSYALQPVPESRWDWATSTKQGSLAIPDGCIDAIHALRTSVLSGEFVLSKREAVQPPTGGPIGYHYTYSDGNTLGLWLTLQCEAAALYVQHGLPGRINQLFPELNEVLIPACNGEYRQGGVIIENSTKVEYESLFTFYRTFVPTGGGLMPGDFCESVSTSGERLFWQNYEAKLVYDDVSLRNVSTLPVGWPNVSPDFSVKISTQSNPLP